MGPQTFLVRRASRLAGQRTTAIATRPHAGPTSRVRIVEVGPRDGLQNEKKIVPVGTKLRLIAGLARAGLRHIEAGAFVSPKWVPQMADSSAVLDSLRNPLIATPPGVAYSFLVPNFQGLEAALSLLSSPPGAPSPDSVNHDEENHSAGQSSREPPHGLSEIAIFTAATESFARKNINCSIAESIQRFKPVISEAKAHHIRVRAYISVVLGCPYEGPNVSPKAVADLARSLLGIGADEISLGDTTGMGTPRSTRLLLETLKEEGIPTDKLAVHFHDTYGQALVNVSVAFERGIRVFDSSVAGLGGCPYAKGATGNLASEDLVHYLHGMGVETGVDLNLLADVGDWISRELVRQNNSRAGSAIVAKRRDAISRGFYDLKETHRPRDVSQ